MPDTRTKSTGNTPSGFVTFTLHSHLPYVVNHGTWPHGLDWLHEAAAETYLPLLRVFRELEQEGIALKANVNLSPVLLEQLDHPTFKTAFPIYTQQKIDAAIQDEREFAAKGQQHYAEVARYWQRFFANAADEFARLGGDIISGFRHFYDTGAIEIITCGATHGYFALLGSDAAIRAQVRMGVETHRRFFGRKPRGIWLPECAYRPAGEWCYPVSSNGNSPKPTCFLREGVEQILAENGIEFFFVDTHLLESRAQFTPYDMMAGGVPVASEVEGEPITSYYKPYLAGLPRPGEKGVALFARDPKTGIQVWSGDVGYPGEASYLDFHKKHWPGGHRYWQVTHSKADLGDKTEYHPERALAKTSDHAVHFAQLVNKVLEDEPKTGDKPYILTAPFDAELFGHWWFEGPEWLKHVAQELARPESKVKLITCAEYLDQYGAAGYLAIPEGSWGRNGTHEVWLNPETAWTWKHIYPAEAAVLQMAESGRWRGDPTGERLAKQLCRELLLLESSDWQFLITTGAARDYAEIRFLTHNDQFNEVKAIWQTFDTTGSITPEQDTRLAEIELRDSVFPDIDPSLWATGAHATHLEAATAAN